MTRGLILGYKTRGLILLSQCLTRTLATENPEDTEDAEKTIFLKTPVQLSSHGLFKKNLGVPRCPLVLCGQRYVTSTSYQNPRNFHHA